MKTRSPALAAPLARFQSGGQQGICPEGDFFDETDFESCVFYHPTAR